MELTRANVDVIDSILWLLHVNKDFQREYDQAESSHERMKIARKLLIKANEVSLYVQKDFALKGLEINRPPICISYEFLPTQNIENP